MKKLCFNIDFLSEICYNIVAYITVHPLCLEVFFGGMII